MVFVAALEADDLTLGEETRRIASGLGRRLRRLGATDDQSGQRSHEPRCALEA